MISAGLPMRTPRAALHGSPEGRAGRVRGFTLVEVLVALLIMSILAVMSWQGVDGIVRTRDASKARLDATLRLNTVLAQWEQDLNAMQGSGVPVFRFDGASMRITRRADRGLQVVVWSLRPGLEGTQSGQTWVRWTGTPTVAAADLQQAWLSSQQLQGTEIGSVRVLEGISQWQLYCYRNNAWTNCQSSNDLAVVATGASGVPLTTAEQLPTGVRLVLTFADGSGQVGTLTRDVSLGPQWPG